VRFWAAILFWLVPMGFAAAQSQNPSINVSSTNPPHVIRGSFYSQAVVQASGTVAPYTFVALTSPPVGLTLASDGVLSGTTCKNNGSFSFTVQATDATGDFNTGSVTVIVNAAPSNACTLTINPSSLPNPAVGMPYSQTVTATGGNGPYTYAVNSGSLPAGLSLNTSTGVISGTPTFAGPSSFTISASDPSGFSGVSATYTLTVSGNTLTISPATLPNGTKGTAYSQTLATSGGTAPYTYSVSGSLPAGLTLSASTGALTGTPTSTGTSSFTIGVSDVAGSTGAKAYTLTVAAPPLTISPATLPNGAQGTAYSETVTASGGTGPYTYSLASGTLPAGLGLNASTGVIAGTPTGSGASSFTIGVADSAGGAGTKAYTLTVTTTGLTIGPGSLPNGSQGTAYNQTLTGSGGSGPYTYSIASGTLPAGLTVNSSTGAITGTPTGSGTSSFTIAIGDSAGSTGTRAYTLTVTTTALTIGPASLPNGVQGTAYSQTLTTTGGTGPYTYSTTAGTLPAGLTLSGSTGAITGTPAGSGMSTFTIAVADSAGSTGTKTYSVMITTTALTISPASLPNGAQGTAYSQTLTTTGGTGPYTYSLASGTLPGGLALNSSTGAITGTPSGSGASSFTVGVADTAGSTGTKAYTLTVTTAALTIGPASLANGAQGAGYNQTLTTSGGTGPYTYSVASGILPAGLTLNGASGVITGTPTGGGTSSFTIAVADSAGSTGTKAYTLTVTTTALTMAPASLPSGAQGTAYSQTLTTTGGTGPYTYSFAAGGLPAGLSLNSSTGAITGTPTGSGATSVTIGVADSAGSTGTKAYTLTITTTALAIGPATLPSGARGTAYSQTLTASGGTGPYSYSLASGTLPAGLVLNASTGAITGTPTASGTSNFTIALADSAGSTGTKAYTVTVTTTALTISPASLPNGAQGAAYSQTLTASGGTGPYTYSLASGTLPVGLTLNGATGAISGTPTGFGTSSFTIGVADSAGSTGTKAYALTVTTAPALAVAPASLPNGAQGTPYAQTITASGGTAPYTYSLAAGALPAGLTLNASTGAIAGTPSAAGVSSFTIGAADSAAHTGAMTYTVTVTTTALVISPASLPNPAQGVAYSQTLTTTGGTAPYTYSLASGALPAGLGLNASTGAISGTPTGSGGSSFTVAVSDSAGSTGSRAYAVIVTGNTLTIAPASLPNGARGSAYSQSLSASGGTGPYTYSLASGTLPAGLALNVTTGAITGTPTGSGSSSFTIGVVDSIGSTGTKPYTVTVAAPSLTIGPASLPNATQGASYSQTLTPAGGTGPYTFSLASGTLPAGLSLNASTGAITGTPTGSGASTFTVSVSDSAGVNATKAYTVTVTTTALTISPASLPNGTQGTAYRQTLTAIGGAGSYTYSVASGALPPGLTLNTATGAVAGTPTGSGSSSFAIAVADSAGSTGTRAYTLQIGARLTASNGSLVVPYNGSQTLDLTALTTGDIAVLTIARGAAHGSVSLSGRSVTYRAHRGYSGPDSFAFAASSADGRSATGTVTVTVGARPAPVDDAALRGTLAAQFAAERRFVSTQTENVHRRLERLHDDRGCSVDLGVAFSEREATERNVLPDAPLRGTLASGASAERRRPTAQEQAADRPCLRGASPVGVWANGQVELGSATSVGGRSKFSSSGVTAGMDWKLSRDLTVGLAAGFGADTSELADFRQSARHGTVVGYASYRPFGSIFIDTLVGYGLTSFDLRRTLSHDEAVVTANRPGSQWLGSASITAELRRGALSLAPYLRADGAIIQLGRYSEQGSDIWALRYGAASSLSVAGIVGIRGAYDIPVSWGTLSPNVRVEYRHEIVGGVVQRVGYADLGPELPYVLRQSAEAEGSLRGTVGLRFTKAGSGATLDVEYGNSVTRNRLGAHSLRGAARVAF
jgi:uncharacterized protein YhjY with autotransporter beta-barrel domain